MDINERHVVVVKKNSGLLCTAASLYKHNQVGSTSGLLEGEASTEAVKFQE